MTPVAIVQPEQALHYMIAVEGTLPGRGGGTGTTGQMIGEIRLFAGTTAPNGWLFCDGQSLPVSQYLPLFSILGFAYGGDQVQTFDVPDLRDRVAVGADSNIPDGSAFGSESVSLTESQVAIHYYPLPGGGNSNVIGGSQPINITSPSLGLNYIISVSDTYQDLGQIRLFAGNFAPEGWMLANGQILPVNENQALFSKMLFSYGSYSNSKFELPKLNGTTAIGIGNGPEGNLVFGDTEGPTTVTMSNSELPARTFPLPGGGTSGVSGYTNPTPLPTIQPSLTVNYLISTAGVAPSSGVPLAEGESYIGEVRAYTSVNTPTGWLPADGRLLPISQYSTLFAFIGTTYGGNGITMICSAKSEWTHPSRRVRVQV